MSVRLLHAYGLLGYLIVAPGPAALSQEPFDWEATPVLHRTLAGSIGERRLELELRLEQAEARGRLRVDGEDRGWLTGKVAADGATRLEAYADSIALDGRLRVDTPETVGGPGIVFEGHWLSGIDGPPPMLELAEKPALLGAGAMLTGVDIRSGDPARGWTFYARMPWIEGSSAGDREEGMAGFNRAVETFFNEAEREFAPPDGALEEGLLGPGPWSYEAWYRAPLAGGRLLSVELTIFMYTGGAHPNTNFRTFNWDLTSGRALELRDLFRPDVDPLPALAELARPDLEAGLGDFADRGWIREGTGPDPQNWMDWTLSKAGLEIVFEPYQVAPYAAGPQRVTIAWPKLRHLLDAEGPIGAIR